MDLNILHPGKVVESAFEKPSMLLALLLVLLPSIASIAGRVAYGMPFKAEDAIYSVVLAYVAFFALALVLFALAVLLKGGETKGKFAGFFSALSLIKIASLAIVLLSVVSMPLYLSPAALKVAVSAAGSASPEMAAGQVMQLLEQDPNAVNIPVVVALLAIAFCIFLWGLFLVYLTTKKIAGSGKLAAIALTVIAFIILGVLPI